MIAKAISEYLKQNGIKKQFLSEKTGINKNAICASLSGKRKIMVDEYAAICDALGVSYDFFIHRPA